MAAALASMEPTQGRGLLGMTQHEGRPLMMARRCGRAVLALLPMLAFAEESATLGLKFAKELLRTSVVKGKRSCKLQ